MTGSNAGRAPTTAFDAALFVVADCLSEARDLERIGRAYRARTLYAFAEAYALRTGFVELAHLVWAYEDGPGGSGAPARQHA